MTNPASRLRECRFMSWSERIFSGNFYSPKAFLKSLQAINRVKVVTYSPRRGHFFPKIKPKYIFSKDQMNRPFLINQQAHRIYQTITLVIEKSSFWGNCNIYGHNFYSHNYFRKSESQPFCAKYSDQKNSPMESKPRPSGRSATFKPTRLAISKFYL